MKILKRRTFLWRRRENSHSSTFSISYFSAAVEFCLAKLDLHALQPRLCFDVWLNRWMLNRCLLRGLQRLDFWPCSTISNVRVQWLVPEGFGHTLSKNPNKCWALQIILKLNVFSLRWREIKFFALRPHHELPSVSTTRSLRPPFIVVALCRVSLK